MPYIDPYRRESLDRELDLGLVQIESAGELNYAITKLFIRYMQCHGLSYSTINDIVGAAEGAKMEFYRRVAAPYEDKKIHKNGDVY